jgi:hypothetical protein
MVFGELFIGNSPFARRRGIKLGLNLRQALVGRKPRFDRDAGLTALTNFLRCNRIHIGKFGQERASRLLCYKEGASRLRLERRSDLRS